MHLGCDLDVNSVKQMDKEDQRLIPAFSSSSTLTECVRGILIYCSSTMEQAVVRPVLHHEVCEYTEIEMQYNTSLNLCPMGRRNSRTQSLALDVSLGVALDV